jgi:H/ACA ribonucleoprotein complex subunit 4
MKSGKAMKGAMKAGGGLERSVILIDKPCGPTSFDVVETVSGLLSVRKAGHSGTLDPNATGLLVIALGEARKAMPVLMGLDKEYIGVMRLHGDVRKAGIEKALKSFEGEITQVPPVRSAVARKPRKRHVYGIEVLKLDGRDVEFGVRCEAGTYIRKIAHDAGQSLGCGAHLIELRRMKVGPFTVEDAVSVDELRKMSGSEAKKALIPLEHALDKIELPRIVVKGEHEPSIRNGSPIRKDFVLEMPEGLEEGRKVGVYNEKGIIVCLAMVTGSGESVAKVERVFLQFPQ